MKAEIIIILVSFVFVFGFSFLFFVNPPISLTGLVIQNDSVINQTVVVKSSTNISITEVLDAINESKKIINEMKKSNFSVSFVNDTVTEAIMVFRQAAFAEILRDVNANESKKREAQKALEFVNWKNITYSDVLRHTYKIEVRKAQAYLLVDVISVKEAEFANEFLDITQAKSILDQAKKAFYEDRFDDVEQLLVEAEKQRELVISDAATLRILKRNSQNFVGRYWKQMLVFVLLLGIVLIIFLRQLKKYRLKKKIKKMRAGKFALLSLMKKAQKERFEENKISKLVYKIRMKNYQEKLNKIKQSLPVLEGWVKGKK